jgi:hypothetical protein
MLIDSIESNVAHGGFENDLGILLWFAVEIVASDIPHFSQEEKMLNFVKTLIESEHFKMTDHATRLKNMLMKEGEETIVLKPRHDNELDNYRLIRILPTSDELACPHEPFLLPIFCPDEDTLEENIYFDRLFRLIRQDIVGTFKEEIEAKMKSVLPKAFENARIDAISFVPDDKKSKGISCQVSFDMPPMSQNQKRSVFWQSTKAKVLPWNSMIYFVKDNKVLAYGTVCKREMTLLDPKVENKTGMAPRPCIGISFDSCDDLISALKEIKFKKSTDSNIRMIQMSSAFFAYRPILESLQRMCSLPFAEEILNNLDPKPVSYFNQLSYLYEEFDKGTSCTDFGPMLRLPNPKLMLNSSQIEAIKLCLKSRVALVQGPPGTGKSFCGALLAKMIHDHTDQKVLCVCYTNHALDQFLENLINIGVPEKNIVRIGVESKISEKLKSMSLRTLTRGPSTLMKRDFVIRDRCLSQKKDLEGELKTAFDDFCKCYDDSFGQSWDDVDYYLWDTYFSCAKAFQIPKSEDGFSFAGKKRKELKSNDLWNEWLKGKSPCIPCLQSHELWNYSKAERLTLWNEWIQEIRHSAQAAFEEKMKRYYQVNQLLEETEALQRTDILMSKRIVG